MVTVPGTINIRSVPGRFGDFNVGTLECDLGTFSVKDPSIEEFDPGIYHGDFVIDKIKPSSYISGGRLVVEVRATLLEILLSEGCEPEPPVFEPLEQDPIEEDYAGNHNGQGYANCQTQSGNYNDDNQDDEIASLFGHLWPLDKVVKLDATVHRSILRQQKEYLDSMGYTFVPARQHWVRGN
jgi:hypothetical protein